MRQARRNKRIFKKLCKKAKELLIRLDPKFQHNFQAADGDIASTENVYIGTWMIWTHVGWEYDEWDCEPTFDCLHEWLYWKLIDISPETGDIISQPKFKTSYDCIRQAEAYIAKNERTKKEMN